MSTTSLDNSLNWRWTNLLTKQKWKKQPMVSKTMLKWETNPPALMQSSFFGLLLYFCRDVVDFRKWSRSLKKRHDVILLFWKLRVLFWQGKNLLIWVSRSHQDRIGRHGLTNGLGRFLININPNNCFANACGFSLEFSIKNCFACRNKIWSTNSIFSNYLHCSLCEGIDF